MKRMNVSDRITKGAAMLAQDAKPRDKAESKKIQAAYEYGVRTGRIQMQREILDCLGVYGVVWEPNEHR